MNLVNYLSDKNPINISKGYYFIDTLSEYIEISYWFLYIYNGPISSFIPTVHEGDWEHIVVKVDKLDLSIIEIMFASHNSKRWVDKNLITFDIKTGRPLVYVALNSHASYEKPIKYQRGIGVLDFLIPDDTCSLEGVVWDSFNNLQNFNRHSIINEKIHWGNHETHLISFLNGPISPFYQK